MLYSWRHAVLTRLSWLSFVTTHVSLRNDGPAVIASKADFTSLRAYSETRDDWQQECCFTRKRCFQCETFFSCHCIGYPRGCGVRNGYILASQIFLATPSWRLVKLTLSVLSAVCIFYIVVFLFIFHKTKYVSTLMTVSGLLSKRCYAFASMLTIHFVPNACYAFTTRILQMKTSFFLHRTKRHDKFLCFLTSAAYILARTHLKLHNLPVSYVMPSE